MSECWPLQDMNASQKAVLISLADNANDDGVCWPSVDYIAMRTCLSVRSVQTAIKWLRDHGALKIVERTGRSSVYYLTPAEFAPLQNVRGENNAETPANNVTTPAKSATTPADAAPITISNRNRTVIEPSKGKKSRPEVELPDWLAEEDWDDWLDHRIAVGAPMTQNAAERCLKRLATLRQAGNDPALVIDQSIRTGKWTDLYPVKDQQSGVPGGGKFNPAEAMRQRDADRNGRKGAGDVIDV